MKKFALMALLCATLFCSCLSRADGDWDPIELSQSKVVFGAQGGSCTVQAKNYSSWWINGIQDISADTCYIAYSDSTLTRKLVQGNGISAQIGEKENTVIITVDSSACSHSWKVLMQAGDAFTSIPVTQN